MCVCLWQGQSYFNRLPIHLYQRILILFQQSKAYLKTTLHVCISVSIEKDPWDPITFVKNANRTKCQQNSFNFKVCT